MVVVKEVEKNFFGLSLDTQSNNNVDFKAERILSLTMASLDTSTNSDEYVPVYAQFSDANKFLLCTLSKKHSILQQPLQIMLNHGENVTFHLSSTHGRVHLSGYFLNDDPFFGEQEDLNAAKKSRKDLANLFLDEEVGDSDDEDDDDEDEDLDEEDEEEDEDEDEDEEDEEDEDEEDEEEEEEEEEDEVGEEEEQSGKRKASKNDQQNNNKKNKQEEAPKLIKNEQAQQQPQEKKIQGGVIIKDLKEGKGPEAKKGKSIHVYYAGRLKSNGKQFDACVSGKPFRFRLGAGEVIKGWDVGFENMKVGGKRQIVVPPNMGYGNKRIGNDIPANSTLVFDVELKAVN